MRLTKTVQIGDRRITVCELRVADIRKLLEKGEDLENMGVDAAIETVLPMVCDLPAEEFDELGLSSLMILWDAAREINAAFFDLARRAGLTETVQTLMAEMRGWIEQGLKEASAALSSEDMPTQETMDGSSS